MGLRYVMRKANPDDCGSILRLIKELAAFGGVQPDTAVQNTEQALLNDGFGNEACCHFLVVDAVENGGATDGTEQVSTVGYAVYFFTYSTWIGRLIYLEDLFLQPVHRGKGIGKALVCKVAKIGAEKGCKGMQWMVIDSNETARQFYALLNASDMTAENGWRLMGSRGDRFVKLANWVPKPESNIQIL